MLHLAVVIPGDASHGVKVSFSDIVGFDAGLKFLALNKNADTKLTVNRPKKPAMFLGKEFGRYAAEPCHPLPFAVAPVVMLL